MNNTANTIFNLPVHIKIYKENEATDTQEAIEYIVREIGTKGVLALANKHKNNPLVRTIVKSRLGVALPGMFEHTKSIEIPAIDQHEAFKVRAAIEYILKELGANGVVKLRTMYSDPEVKALVKTAIS